MVNHGGNLVGFSSMVAVVPEHNLGIVVLTNAHGTPLRDVLPLVIVDRGEITGRRCVGSVCGCRG